MSCDPLPARELTVRLHITPFNPDIANRILPPSLQALARNSSFHTVQTFPEKGYGFVELPNMEAEKLKKKLNGAVLRGTKVRIEDARPLEKRKSDAEEVITERKPKKAKKERTEKKSKDKDVVPGFELPEGRHVKRGWEDKVVKKTKDKKRSEKGKKSRDVSERKLLFKTTAPPNTITLEEKGMGKAKKNKKEKKEQIGKKSLIVEEFENNVRPTAGAELALEDVSPASKFEDDIGWVNSRGETVEPAPKSKRPVNSNDIIKMSKQKLADEETSYSEDSSELDESSVLSDDTDSDEASSLEEDHEGPSNTSSKDVHPLEALFKRPASGTTDTPFPKPKPSLIDTSFSFFNSGSDDEEGETEDTHRAIPQTPHTKQDMEGRQVRSAAPTPDTAAIGKRFRFPTPVKNDQSEDDESETVQEETGGPSKGVEHEESEFRKWFYENRGDLNRSWKKRRREERKAKRQRENRRISRRVV